MRVPNLSLPVLFTTFVACSGGSQGRDSAEIGGGKAGLGGASGTTIDGSGGGGSFNATSGEPTPAAPLRVIVFSKTAGFRHDSIPEGRAALTDIADRSGWTFSATEDASVFAEDTLASVDVVVFLSTTGNVLDEPQQAAFERFLSSGKGFVGIHSASDTEYDWPFYGGLVGAYFREHPAIQQATLHVEDPADPTMVDLPASWTRTDEWYSFRERPDAHVVMTLDETSYSPGTSTMGGEHPMTWLHEYEGGRSFYTALGHTKESYSEPLFLEMLTHAIEWAGRR